MSSPEWVRPAVMGVLGGAIAISVVGFSWGGWMTSNAARKLASEESRVEVAAVLVPICVELAKRDPQSIATMAKLKEASSYQRSEMLIQAGWATMPGSSDPNRAIAAACAAKLSEQL